MPLLRTSPLVQFQKKVVDIIAPKQSIIFPMLIRLGSFPKCWRSTNVTAIPKGAPSPDRENYRPISITPILSKVHEKLVPHKLSSFCEKYGLLPSAQFDYRKGLGCTDALLAISHHLQKSLDVSMESYIVQLDLSAAFDRMSHNGLLFKLTSICVGDYVLSICTEFLSDRRQRVVVDGAASEYIPAKCVSWLRSVYLPMQMIPHYWQLFASQQTDLLLLHSLMRT